MSIHECTTALPTLAVRLKFAREAAGLNQIQLAEMAGVSQTAISWLEVGKTLRTGFLAEIAKALCVDALWLALGEGSAPDPIAARDNQLRHDAEKWEALYRNEHANCTRLLDTVTGLRAEIAALNECASERSNGRVS